MCVLCNFYIQFPQFHARPAPLAPNLYPAAALPALLCRAPPVASIGTRRPRRAGSFLVTSFSDALQRAGVVGLVSAGNSRSASLKGQRAGDLIYGDDLAEDRD